MWPTSLARSASGSGSALIASLAVPIAGDSVSAPDSRPAARPPGRAHGDGEQGPAGAAALHRLEEIRPDRVADAEQEQQEQERLGGTGNRHLDHPAEQHADHQRPRHRAEAEAAELEAADPVAEPDDEEHRQLRVLRDEGAEPGQDASLP
jgi:hypothetical protein